MALVSHSIQAQTTFRRITQSGSGNIIGNNNRIDNSKVINNIVNQYGLDKKQASMIVEQLKQNNANLLGQNELIAHQVELLQDIAQGFRQTDKDQYEQEAQRKINEQDFDGARQSLRQALSGSIDQANDYSTKLLTLQRLKEGLVNKDPLGAETLGNHPEDVVQITQIMSLYRDQIEGAFKDAAVNYYTIAAISEFQLDYRSALENYNEALILDSTNVKYLISLANIYFKFTRFDLSIQYYEKALSLLKQRNGNWDIKNVNLYFNLARTWMAWNDSGRLFGYPTYLPSHLHPDPKRPVVYIDKIFELFDLHPQSFTPLDHAQAHVMMAQAKALIKDQLTKVPLDKLLAHVDEAKKIYQSHYLKLRKKGQREQIKAMQLEEDYNIAIFYENLYRSVQEINQRRNIGAYANEYELIYPQVFGENTSYLGKVNDDVTKLQQSEIIPEPQMAQYPDYWRFQNYADRIQSIGFVPERIATLNDRDGDYSIFPTPTVSDFYLPFDPKSEALKRYNKILNTYLRQRSNKPLDRIAAIYRNQGYLYELSLLDTYNEQAADSAAELYEQSVFYFQSAYGNEHPQLVNLYLRLGALEHLSYATDTSLTDTMAYRKHVANRFQTALQIVLKDFGPKHYIVEACYGLANNYLDNQDLLVQSSYVSYANQVDFIGIKEQYVDLLSKHFLTKGKHYLHKAYLLHDQLGDMYFNWGQYTKSFDSYGSVYQLTSKDAQWEQLYIYHQDNRPDTSEIIEEHLFKVDYDSYDIFNYANGMLPDSSYTITYAHQPVALPELEDESVTREQYIWLMLAARKFLLKHIEAGRPVHALLKHIEEVSTNYTNKEEAMVVLSKMLSDQLSDKYYNSVSLSLDSAAIRYLKPLTSNDIWFGLQHFECIKVAKYLYVQNKYTEAADSWEYLLDAYLQNKHYNNWLQRYKLHLIAGTNRALIDEEAQAFLHYDSVVVLAKSKVKDRKYDFAEDSAIVHRSGKLGLTKENALTIVRQSFEEWIGYQIRLGDQLYNLYPDKASLIGDNIGDIWIAYQKHFPRYFNWRNLKKTFKREYFPWMPTYKEVKYKRKQRNKRLRAASGRKFLGLFKY